MTDLDTLLAQAATADALYVPTRFWQPGVEMLVRDLREKDFATFKTWPSSQSYFYQSYGQRYAPPLVDDIWNLVEPLNRHATRPWLNQMLLGSIQAHRDMDVAMARWNQRKWPFDFQAFGESDYGGNAGTFALFGPGRPRYGKAYLSYLLILAELSNHIDKPISSILEIGGGFGALGEIVLARDSNATYTDVDIPPTLCFARAYVAKVIGRGTFMPTWELPSIKGKFDLFINAYSFQEMEPAIVANYISQVCRIRPKFVVSLNSRAGKPKAADVGNGRTGVIEPVVSDFIRQQFEAKGYRTVAAVGRPYAPAQAELLIMKRSRYSSGYSSTT